MASKPVRPFTGRHATAIIAGFFAVVIAVNVLMARLAISTFGGIVVENSYVASQNYNTWLDEAAKEKALGWQAGIDREGGDVVVSLADSANRPITGAKVAIDAVHPLGRVPDHALMVREIAPGRYAAPLTAGRWRLRIAASAQGHTWRTVGDLQ